MAQITTRKRGKTWEYSFEIAPIDGKRKRYSKGGFRTKAECLQAGTQAKAEYDNDGSVFKASDMTLNELSQEWLKDYVKKNCKNSTYMHYMRTVNLHIEPYFNNCKLKSITPKLVQDFVYHLQTKLSTRTTKLVKTIFHNLMDYAVFPCEYIKVNPTKNIKVKNKDVIVNKKQTITPEEFNMILDYARSLNDYFEIPLMIGWYTGARLGEILALNWSDVDFDNKVIHFDKSQTLYGDITTPKTPNSIRDVLVSEHLIDYLKSRPRKHEAICTNIHNERLYNNYVTFTCKKASRILGIKFHFHLLRHTHATLLIQNGANIKDVQLRLGHSSIKITLDTYTHKEDSSSQQSVNILDSLTIR